MYTHYPSEGYSSLSVCIRWISKWLLCKMQMPAELDRTQWCQDLPQRVASCRIPLEKILTEIKSKQPIVLTNRVKESLPLGIVHCKLLIMAQVLFLV